MLFRNLLIVFLTLFVHSLYGQSDQKKFLVAGKVINSKTGRVVPLAHIILNGKRKVTACDDWGGYRILLLPGESITVTAIGYKSTVFMLDETICKDTYREILLDPISYKLEEITISNLGTWEQFKQEFINMELKSTNQQQVVNNINQSIAQLIKKNMAANIIHNNYTEKITPQKGIVFTVGFSTGVSWRNKKDTRANREMQNLTKEYKYAKVLASKFNMQIVSDITGEKDKYRLDKLMTYINEKSTFTHKTKTFEILKEIKELYAKFIVIYPPFDDKFKQDTI